MDIIQQKDLGFSGDRGIDAFLCKPKLKFVNKSIQKPMQSSLRQSLVKENIAKILDDPVLNQIDSPKGGAEEELQAEKIEEKLKSSIDTATQMTDRGVECKCASLTASMLSNEISEIGAKTEHLSGEGAFEKFALANSENAKDSARPKAPRYTSPMFRQPSLSSQVFKQRINERVIKMNTFNYSKYSTKF